MAAPTITQPSFPDGTLKASPPLFWLKADGTLCLVNDTTPLPVTGSFTATVDSEFVTAAALNGTWAKTTVTTIGGAAVMLSDGTNLVLAVGGSGVDATTVQRVSLATNVALPSGTNLLGKFGIDQTIAGSTNGTQQKQYTGTPSSYAVATADGTVFTLAAGEIGFIQNLDSADALAVKKGASASTSSFSMILAAGAAQDDGKGGFVTIDDWIGAVSVATMTGTARYIAYKIAP